MKALATAILITCLAPAMHSQAVTQERPPQFISIEAAKKTIEIALAKMVKNEVIEAFDVIAPYFIIPKSELDAVSLKILQQRNLAMSRYGAGLTFELITENKAGSSVVNLTYLEKRQEMGMRWIFTLYRADKTWTIVNFNWDDKINNL